MVSMTVSGAVLLKAGDGVNTSLVGEGVLGMTACEIIGSWIDEAEGLINTVTRKDYSGTYSGLNSNVQGVLSGATSSFAAISAINYDMSGYSSRAEAQSMIDVLRDSGLRTLSLLKDQKKRTFINDA